MLEIPSLHVLSLHLVLVLALVALVGAAWRLSAALAPDGLARVVATAPIAATAAVVHSLTLGLVSLGSSPPALAVAAGCTWLAARRLVRAPSPTAHEQLVAWCRRARPLELAALGALAGALLVYIGWVLLHPSLGLDGVAYHLSEVAMWVQQGTPGSRELVVYDYPVTSYPVTNEVLLTWAAGISRGFPVTVAWSPLVLALGIAGGWLGLRELRVPGFTACSALAVIALTPLAVDQLRQPGTDIPALAWLACTAGLAAACRRSPRLLAPALLAAGLAAGTKTTVLPFAAVALILAFWLCRRELRRLARPLALATAAALVAGGVWYLRNLLDHGTPTWPFVAAPWGDPVPPYMARLDVSLLERAGPTLEGRLDDYARQLAGALLVLAGAVAAPLLARRRDVAIAAATVLGGALLWAAAPFTGSIEANPLVDPSLHATRYLLPTIATAALALALAAREAGWRGRAASAVLVAALGWSAVRAMQLPFPFAPEAPLIAAAGAAGAAVALAGAAALRRYAPLPWPPLRTAVAGAGLALTAGALLAASAPGFVQRHAEVPSLTSAVAGWAESQPGFRDEEFPVEFAPGSVSVLAGPRLQHPLRVIPPAEPCRRALEQLRQGWLVVFRPALAEGLPLRSRGCLSGARPAFTDDGMAAYTSRPRRR